MESKQLEQIIHKTVKEALLQAHPVGSYFITEKNDNPGILFGGVWTKIEGVFLLGSSSSHKVKSTGGKENVTLNVNNLPAHSHSANTNNTGNHTHTRGSMEIQGDFRSVDMGGQEGGHGVFNQWPCSGALNPAAGNNGVDTIVDFYASRNWTGNTSSNGAHSHSITVYNTGGNQAHENMPPFRTVNIWRRDE